MNLRRNSEEMSKSLPGEDCINIERGAERKFFKTPPCSRIL